MKSILSKEVIARLKDKIPAFKYVGRYNNQFANERNEAAFGYPCALVETRDFVYTDHGVGLQKYTCIVRIHIGFESYRSEEYGDMDLSTEVFKYLHKFSPTEHVPLVRIGESADSDHNNVYLPFIDFRTAGAEIWTKPDDKEVSNLALETTTDLMIQDPANNPIRTGPIE